MAARKTPNGPMKPFHCLTCGERKPWAFRPGYKSVCEMCRSDREAARLRAKSQLEQRA